MRGFAPADEPLSLYGQRKGRKKTAPVAWSSKTTTALAPCCAAGSRLRHFRLRILLRLKSRAHFPVRPFEALLLAPVPKSRARTSCHAPLRASLARNGASARSNGGVEERRQMPVLTQMPHTASQVALHKTLIYKSFGGYPDRRECNNEAHAVIGIS